MEETFNLNRRTTQRVAQATRRVLDRGRPQPEQPHAIGSGPGAWYWGELLTDVAAPTSNGWTGPTAAYAKIMVPDPASIGVDEPVHFHELGKGVVSSVTPSTSSPAMGIVITSAAHGLREGRSIWIKYASAPGGMAYQVGVVTDDTFELAGTTGSGSDLAAGTWYIAVRFTNRDPSLAGLAGAICKLEHGFGEWSLKWIGC